jgi:tRNA pseudouridine13 synthase
MRASPHPLEQSLGISWYATDTPGIGGYLRREPEDFVVVEEPAGPWGETGPYLVLRLTKRNWEQQRLVKELARALGISHRRISWAGTKDRRAVTTQFITIHGIGPEAVERVSLNGVSLEVVGRSGHAIPLGGLKGNRFSIRIRDCDPEELAERVAEVARAGAPGSPRSESPDAGSPNPGVPNPVSPGSGFPNPMFPNRGYLTPRFPNPMFPNRGYLAPGFPNYVGIQRFGVIRPVTHLVGERILRGDTAGAAMAYLGASFPGESEEVREARETFFRDRDAKEALRIFPVRLTFERAMLHHLDQHPGDEAGALRALPPKLLSLFVSAFQSFLFNTLLSRRCGEGIPLDAPAPGDRLLFAGGKEDRVTEGNLGAAALQVRRGRAVIGLFVPGSGGRPPPGRDGDPAWELLGELGISGEDFARASGLVGAAYEGMTRPVALTAGIDQQVEGRDVTLGFFLGPGQYATTVCREFMKADPVRMI